MAVAPPVDWSLPQWDRVTSTPPKLLRNRLMNQEMTPYTPQRSRTEGRTHQSKAIYWTFQDALLHTSAAASGSLKYSDRCLIPSDISKTFLPRELSLTGYLFKHCGSVGKSQSSSSLCNTPRLHAQTHGAALTNHWAGVPNEVSMRTERYSYTLWKKE